MPGKCKNWYKQKLTKVVAIRKTLDPLINQPYGVILNSKLTK